MMETLPLELAAALVFSVRLFLQWRSSERAGTPVVSRNFWVLSYLGDGLSILIALIQENLSFGVLTAAQIPMAWRNLDFFAGRRRGRAGAVFGAVVGCMGGCFLLFLARSACFPPFSPPFEPHLSQWIYVSGAVGTAAYALRFWVQWWESECLERSVLPESFWWLSIIGSVASGIYFFCICDWIQSFAIVCALVPHSRNLLLAYRSDVELCDVVLVAGEASGDLLGGEIARGLRQSNPHITMCGVAGPAMRAAGVVPWIDLEAFQVMGFVDVVKRAPCLFSAVRKLIRNTMQSRPAILFFIDQPSLSLAVAKRLRAQGYAGRLVQVVAPTVWAYKPERSRAFAAHFDHILPLFRFEVSFFRDLMPTTWLGHPVLAGSLRDRASADRSSCTTLALFPGSRPGEVRRNLPLQLAAAKLILQRHGPLSVAISVVDGLEADVEKMANTVFGPGRYTCVSFSERYDLMRRSKCAISKSGTVTLELALCAVPTVVCYQTGLWTRVWLERVCRLAPRLFALPNVLTGRPIFPECIIPPVSAESLAQGLAPYLSGEAALPDDLYTLLKEQIDPQVGISSLLREVMS